MLRFWICEATPFERLVALLALLALIYLAMISACAPPVSGIRATAQARFNSCLSASVEPIVEKESCTKDAQKYCLSQHLICDAEELWQGYQIGTWEKAKAP